MGKGLTRFLPEDLMEIALRALMHRTSLYPQAVDGVLVGWVGQGSHAPNIARVSALKAGLPEKVQAYTVQQNCISSLETVAAAYRHIVMGDGDLYLAGGTESMSNFPYAIRGSRDQKKLRSLETVKSNWNELWNDPNVVITDTTEEGLTDPLCKINMAATAEICAQIYSISREAQDAYALASFKKGLSAQQQGFYKSHVIPVKSKGDVVCEQDEYPFLRSSIVEKPRLLDKAPTLFDSSSSTIENFYRENAPYIVGKNFDKEKTKATVTLFNACARSDGAAAVIVTSEERARDLGLQIMAEVHSWGFWGTSPAYMGIAPVFATSMALERAGMRFTDLDQIELHEAFAATCLSIFRVGKEKYRQNWESANEQGILNPNGGTLSLGHPLAATGVRLLLNLIYAMKDNSNARYGLAAACASGGLGGAMILKKA